MAVTIAGAHEALACRTVYQTAKDAGLNTLVAAVDAAGLKSVLNDPELAVTVLAPTEEAFAKLLDQLHLTAEQLLGDTDLLTNVLKYHVTTNPWTTGSVKRLSTKRTLLGSGFPLLVRKSFTGNVKIFWGKNKIEDGDKLDFGGASNVVQANIQACDSIIQVIDEVMIPPPK